MSAEQKLVLHNTLSRSREPFIPIDANNVRMYVCGPTVYDHAHIGNARPVIVFDVLFRLLRHLYGEAHVTYVRNITDVDDKINARARRDFPDLPLNEAISRVTETTTRQFHDDVRALRCLEPTHEPRATDFILARADGRTDMVGLIRELLHRDHAYLATGPEGREILFDVSSMPAYGALSRRRLEEQLAGARVKAEPHKRNPGDFVLWKESGAGEPGWKAAFRVNGTSIAIVGRPGWHIECSAMSAAFLGTEFDIHGGGIDLIFPHHENEIAQSRCAYGTPMMAKYWLHNGFLQVEGRKMAKSEGNFVTIRDLLHTETFGGRRWSGEVLRLAMLMTHYRDPIDFSVRKLEEAESVLDGWYRAIAAATVPDQAITDPVLEPLLDDLNTVGAIAALHELRGRAARDESGSAGSLRAGAALLGLLRDSPGDWFSGRSGIPGIDEDAIAQRIAERLAFIRERNWEEADRIREALLSDGIRLKDSKDPQTGERVTSWEAKR